MIALLFLLAAQPPAADAAPTAENDIVVVGQRVRKLKFRLKTDKAGQPVCRIKRSSGDPDIDSLGCEAARACMNSTTEAAMVACLTPKFNQIPAQLPALRQARTERSRHAPN